MVLLDLGLRLAESWSIGSRTLEAQQVQVGRILRDGHGKLGQRRIGILTLAGGQRRGRWDAVVKVSRDVVVAVGQPGLALLVDALGPSPRRGGLGHDAGEAAAIARAGETGGGAGGGIQSEAVDVLSPAVARGTYIGVAKRMAGGGGDGTSFEKREREKEETPPNPFYNPPGALGYPPSGLLVLAVHRRASGAGHWEPLIGPARFSEWRHAPFQTHRV